MRDVDCALDAFRTADLITGTLSGGIEAPRKILWVEKKDGNIEISYTFSETCGLSDCRYHDTRAGKVFTDRYLILSDRIYLNGSDNIFRSQSVEDEDIKSIQKGFYDRWDLVA